MQHNSIWPERLDENFARTEDNGINFSVTPDVVDKNLVIYANGTELQTTIGESFMAAHLTEDYLNTDVEIKIVDKASGEESEPVYIKVNETN